MRRVIRALGWLVVIGLVLVAAAAAWAVWRLKAALPQTDGSIVIAGPAAPVEILRDRDGVPHVRAASEADAMFGLGVLHAQDRLWQMEFQRRLGRGRLAEVLGPAALPTDRFFRVLDLPGVARENLAHTDPHLRVLIEAYLAGVNAWIAGRTPRTLPIEFSVIGVTATPFTAEDVIVWGKVMALGLSTNWRDEILRARIAGRLGEDAAAALMPAYTAGGPVVLPQAVPVSARTRAPAHAPATPLPQLNAAFLDALAAGGPSIPSGLAASNNWVLHGTRTTTGRPILANDPHLGARAPSIWYLAHVSGGALDVIGATLPGMPGILIGHNQRIAWGETNLMTDVEDLFVERVNAKQEALFADRWEPMRLRYETIAVKNAPAETMVVRTTRHGPIVSDILPGSTQALALRWTALDSVDQTLDAFLGVNLARSWSEFTASLSRLHAPMQNFVYADVDGNIGYYAPGAIPVRAHADGTRPVPGWTGEYEWTGYVPDDQVPRAFNPARGYIATANNQALPDSSAFTISTNWEPGYRAQRIVEMIESRPRHSPDEVARMQADQQSAQARVLLPWLLQARPAHAAASDAMARLTGWNGTLGADSAEAALFEAWKIEAARRLFADDLGPEIWSDYGQTPSWIAKALHRIVADHDESWCDDVTTAVAETCAVTLGAALEDAIAAGTTRYATADPSRWRWGRGNAVTLPHLPFDAVAALRRFFSRTFDAGGDEVTVNPVMRLRDATVISSYRQIVDLSNLDASRFIHSLGQSGELMSGHYDDYLAKWRKVEYVPMRFSRAAVDASVEHRLVLQPPGQSR